MASRLLTKSKFMNGLQCDRLLWTVCNQPKTLPSPDVVSQHIFEQGHEVDLLAKKLHPDGVDISAVSFTDTINKTKADLGRGKPTFQAAFKAGDLYAEVDILVPDGHGRWGLVEVKSSTEVKPEHYPDVAFQRYCCEKAGLSITRCSVTHVNNEYVRKGEINPQELLITEDITTLANGAAMVLEGTIEGMLKVMGLSQCPESQLNPQCREPRDCALLDQCQSFLPDHHVLTLTYGKKAGYTLLSQGVLCIKDIPTGLKLTANQKIQKECVLTNAAHVDGDAIRGFLANLKYPIAYFDFETINPAIPLYDGMRPYQKIPFQFSMVVVPAEGAQPQQFSYLAKSPDDPRLGLLAEMKKRLPGGGSIVVYNKGFEGPILKQLSESFPGYREWLGRVSSRLVDLLEPFKKFQYYHPDQMGSASMKEVLPALTGRSYEGMGVADGETASVLYWNVTHKPAPEADRQKVYADLEKYCGLDTDGMRSIVERLSQL